MKDNPKNKDSKVMQESVDELNNSNGLGNLSNNNMTFHLLRQYAIDKTYDDDRME